MDSRCRPRCSLPASLERGWPPAGITRSSATWPATKRCCSRWQVSALCSSWPVSNTGAVALKCKSDHENDSECDRGSGDALVERRDGAAVAEEEYAGREESACEGACQKGRRSPYHCV